MLHRIAVSGVYHDSFEAIATRWTLAEVRDAHMILGTSAFRNEAYTQTANAGC